MVYVGDVVVFVLGVNLVDERLLALRSTVSSRRGTFLCPSVIDSEQC